ncbi:MAG TPA: MFS transporter [Solirubrobacteraceae bacterium]|nr:MFS transporter [Solirubrobacteraceae bacterium]
MSANTITHGRTLSVAAAGTTLVMAVFSAFVVNVGDSVRTFHASVAGEAWGLSGMSLGLAVALLTGGALADDLGHRRVLRFSAGLLAAASAVGALATSMEILVAARVLQGVAGGGILAAGLGSVGRAFPSGTARTRATAVWGAALGAGVMVGPLGAAGLSAAIGWRGGFWIESAAAAGLMTAVARLSESRPGARRPLDLAGITTLAAGMTLLTAALVETRHGWSAGTALALFGAATLALTAFVRVELRSRHPMLDPRLLANPQFLASISGALFTGLAVVGLMSYAPALMQQSLHISVIGSAAVLAAWSATSMVVALAAGSLPSRLRAQTRLLIGLSLAAGGELALAGLGTGTSWTGLVPGLVITGLGSGIGNASLGRMAVESVPPGRAGMGSGANNTARYLGGAAGAALIVSVASTGGAHRLIAGWNTAALISAGLCVLGVATVASCREWGRRGVRHRHRTPSVPGAPRISSARLIHPTASANPTVAKADPISRRIL